MGIMDFFPGTPRSGQRDVLLAIESAWDAADVFVVEMPVGAGKGHIAYTAARWAASRGLPANIITPTNLLVQQYVKNFPMLFNLQKKEAHRCKCFPDFVPHAEANCDYYHKVNGEHCPDCCFVKKVQTARKAGVMVANYHVLLAHKLHKPVLVVDEAHGLLRMVRDLNAYRLWKKDVDYPNTVTSYGTLLEWLESLKKPSKKLVELRDKLRYATGKFGVLVERTMEDLRGYEEECLKVMPLDVRDAKPVLWPERKVQKLILMSATFNRVDVEALGLSKRRVCYLSTKSPIPPERRPIVLERAANMSFAHTEEEVPHLEAYLNALATRHSKKGLVHATYSLAALLRSRGNLSARFVFHDARNKAEVFESWRKSPATQGQILVGCGMSEGIDLAGPDYEFQCIAKVQFPSLADPAMRYLAETEPENYCWSTLRDFLQSTGRICRGPDDYGITYVADLNAVRLVDQGRSYELIPKWFEEAQTPGPGDVGKQG